MTIKTLVSLSGGVDSATMLAKTLNNIVIEPEHILAVRFQYPSKHNTHEMKAAALVAGYYNVTMRTVDLTGVFTGFKSNLLAGHGPIPEGHYQSESMKQTVVPCRNVIFISILAGLAESVGAVSICIGAHAGDHAIYPDCRPEFLIEMRKAVHFATEDRVYLLAPFVGQTKAEIVKTGLKLQVPYQFTRTCYGEDELACGRCGACQERLEAFAANGRADPIPYATRELLPKETK